MPGPGGFSLPGGVCLVGGGCLPGPGGFSLLRGGVPGPGRGVSAWSRGDWFSGDPPVNRITDTCKNITLATTSMRPVTSCTLPLFFQWSSVKCGSNLIRYKF